MRSATKPAVKPASKRARAELAQKKPVIILHLYANELNIYGDRGNVLALVQRLKWRGYQPVVTVAGAGEKTDISQADIIFGGGGQDRGQIAVGKDLQRHAESIHKAADAGVPMLTICGTYQLFGRDFTTLEGDVIPGIGLFKARTMGSRMRMIGNITIQTEVGKLVGFENHSGRTILEEGQAPLGEVLSGFGNDGRSGQEGAVLNHAYGTYLHGPVLPKNPKLADAIILAALRRRGIEHLEPLNDYLEELTARDAMARPQ